MTSKYTTNWGRRRLGRHGWTLRLGGMEGQRPVWGPVCPDTLIPP